LHHPQTGKTDLSLELAGLKAAELPIRQAVKIEFLIETVGTEVVGRERRADFCSRRPGCLAGVRGFELVNVWPII